MRVAIVCKDLLLRDGIQSVLANEGVLHIAGGVESADLLQRLLGELQDTVLVAVSDDLTADDWKVIGELKAAENTSVIVVSSNGAPAAAAAVADALVKTSEGAQVVIQVVRRLAGAPYGVGLAMSHPASAPAVAMASPMMMAVRESAPSYGTPRALTRREMEVANLVAQGMPNRRIAAVLNLQEQSIKNLVSGIMRKLDCENRVQVALRLSGKVAPGSRVTKMR